MIRAVAVMLVVLATPAAADAAVVDARLPPCGPASAKYGGCDGPDLFIEAAPGERNDVTVRHRPEELRIRDAVTPLRAGPACTQVDAHEVVCRGGLGVIATLGDGDDRLRLDVAWPERQGSGPFPPWHRADGGPGDDVLHGSEHEDRLIGGGGRDTVLGAGGEDRLGDADGLLPDADVLDGGEGPDLVLYDDRLAPVTVDLAAGAGGALGEADRVISVESASGGAGSDRLFGDAGPNSLHGGPGADLLAGRDGEDFFDLRDDGSDTVLAGGGDDELSDPQATTRFSCGDGDDHVRGGFAPRIPDDCETTGESRDAVAITTPLTEPGAVFARLANLPCGRCGPVGPALKVRVVGGRHAGRLVSPLTRAARLNALGRRLLAQRGRLEVQVRYASVWFRLVLRPPRRPAAPSGGA